MKKTKIGSKSAAEGSTSQGAVPSARSGWTVPVDASRPGHRTADTFGHARYASTIAKIIRDAPDGMTIGLFGGYGTGKTWVVNELVESLNIPGSDTRVVEYDAWRYADDEFRRDFLIHLRERLAELGTLDKDAPVVDDSVFRIESAIKLEEPPKLQFGALWRAAWSAPAYVLSAGAILAVAGGVVGFVLNGVGGAIAGGSVGLATGLTWALQEARVLVSVPALSLKKVTETKHPPIELPEEFLKTFKAIVAHRTCDTLVVVLDNLDRCPPDVGMRVLATVKNFLEPGVGRVFFLVPCDREALERHLAALFSGRGFAASDAATDAREYLDKLFSATLTMTPISALHMKSAAEAVVSRLKSMEQVPQTEREIVAAIATTACRRNPRQVAAFLNKVSTALALLAESPDVAGTLSPGTVAKLMALQEFAPALWAVVSKDAPALARYESAPAEWDPKDSEALRLLGALQIRPVSASDIQAFVGLDLPPESRVIPQYLEVVAAIDDADTAALSTLLADASPDVLERVLVDVVVRQMNARRANPALCENPALAGLFIARQASLPQAARDGFLGELDAQVLEAVLPRIGAEAGVDVALAAPAHAKSARLLSLLIAGLSDSGYPDKAMLLQQLQRAEGVLSRPLLEQLKVNVGTLLVAAAEFEENLRPLHVGFKSRIASPSARATMVSRFTTLSGSSAAPAELLPVLARLEPHPELLAAPDMDAIASHASQQLIPRAATDPVAPEDFELFQRVALLASAAGLGEFDGLQSAARAYCDAPSPASGPQLVSLLCKVDSVVGPATRAHTMALLNQVLRSQAPFPAAAALPSIASNVTTLSKESAIGVLKALCPLLQPRLDQDGWHLALDLSRAASAWTELNEALKARITADGADLEWLETWANTNLIAAEFPLALAGALPLLHEPLAQPAGASHAAALALILAPAADESERAALFTRSASLVAKSSVQVAEANASVVDHLMEGVPADGRTELSKRLVDTVASGNWAVGPIVQRLRRAEVEQLPPGPRGSARQAVASAVRSESGTALVQAVEVAEAMLAGVGGRGETAQQLFTASVESAASREPGDDASRLLELADRCWPFLSESSRAGAVSDLQEIGERHQLPSALAAVLSSDSAINRADVDASSESDGS